MLGETVDPLGDVLARFGFGGWQLSSRSGALHLTRERSKRSLTSRRRECRTNARGPKDASATPLQSSKTTKPDMGYKVPRQW
eukprot:140129-Amphidinium_carterae.1